MNKALGQYGRFGAVVILYFIKYRLVFNSSTFRAPHSLCWPQIMDWLIKIFPKFCSLIDESKLLLDLKRI